jgi:hypothetical protein
MKHKKKTTVYEKYRKQTVLALNYPSNKLVTSSDICNYIRRLNKNLLNRLKKEAAKTFSEYHTIKEVSDDDLCKYLQTIKTISF